MRCALLSSKQSPGGLSGALLPWLSSFSQCEVTQICTLPFGPGSWRRYWIVPSHQIQAPLWLLRKACWTLVPFWKCGYCSGWGAACGGREDDEDASSGWAGGSGGAQVGLGGKVGAGARGWQAGALLSFSSLLGARGGLCLFFFVFAWAGLGVLGLGGGGLGRRAV